MNEQEINYLLDHGYPVGWDGDDVSIGDND